MIHTCVKGKGLASLGRRYLCKGAIFLVINMGDYGRHFLSTLLTLIFISWRRLCHWVWVYGFLGMAMPLSTTHIHVGLPSLRAFFIPYPWQYYYMKKGRRVTWRQLSNDLWVSRCIRKSECSQEENSQFIALAFVTLFFLFYLLIYF